MIKRSEFDLLLQEKKMLDSEVLFESIINDKLDEYDFSFHILRKTNNMLY